MGKYLLEAVKENCAGCMRCMLACSDLYTGAFNPLAARIRVNVSGEKCVIEFNDDCNRCGVCADHCFYGALIKHRREDAA